MAYIVITLAYLGILIAIISYKSRLVKTQDDFVVAGRNVPVYLLVGTLVCTWIGSGSLFGSAGLSFRSGFSELWFSLGAWIGIVIVYFIAARVRKISEYTLTDLLEKRYGRSARLLGTITVIISYLVIAGYQFKGGGRLIHIITEGAINPETGTLIACIIIISFTALAGMVSIVSIDIFNGVIMILALILTLPFAISGFGGWDNVVRTINLTNPTHLSMFEGHDALWAFGMILPTLILLLSESSIYQKFSSAKNEKAAKKAVIGMFIGVVAIETLMCVLAVVGYAIYSGDPRFFLESGAINGAMSEEVILRIGYEQVPVFIGSLLFAAAVAIILSTGNTFLMIASTNLARDVYQLYVNPSASPMLMVKVQRFLIVIIGLLALLLMTQFTTILEMLFISYSMIGSSLAPVLLASFFWKRVTKEGGITSIASGMATVLIISITNRIMLAKGLSGSLMGLQLPFDEDYIAIPSLAVSLLSLILVSYLTKPSPESVWKPFFQKD